MSPVVLAGHGVTPVMHRFSTRRRKVVGIALVVSVLSAALWAFLGVHEPSYQGKSLDYWLRAVYSPSTNDAALLAINSIGTESIPHLLRRLGATDSWIKWRVLALGVKLGAIDRSYMEKHSASTRRSEAIAAFKLLGTRAKAAIPQLLVLTKDPDSNVRASAWLSLSHAAGDDFDRYLTTKPVRLQQTEMKVESLSITNN